MKTDSYNILKILEHQGLDQFVIPEVQRDYVWQIPDVKDFLDYIKQGFNGDASDKPYLGFIYAYNDRDYPYKYILIDGQQRMTTIFLLLLAVHHRIGKGLPEYMLNNEHLKLEYKVRQSTSDFMHSLVNHCNHYPGKVFNIRDQIWYHNEYTLDRTINNIVNNYIFLNKWLDKIDEELSDFLHFIEEGVSLSYFDIEESRQGEDLYIYMNSRGRQLEPNETLKAKFLTTTDEKAHWGTKWETWQDFFWKHKGGRLDADDGFNDFLRMAQVISMSKKGTNADEISNFIRTKDVAPIFEKLPQKIEELEAIYDAYVWFVNAPMIQEFYRELGESDSYLTLMPSVNLRQIYFLRVLPVIAFLTVSTCRDELTVMRFARFFYNIARKRETIGKDVGTQLPSAIRLMLEYGTSEDITFDVCDLRNFTKGRTILIDREEVIKLSIINSYIDEEERKRIEILLWKAEDHKIFDGEISFLLNRHYRGTENIFDELGFSNSLDVFQNIFYDANQSHKIAIALLYYGNTWLQATPLYYENYACMNWKELVANDKRVYLGKLIDDMLESEADIDEIITNKIHYYFSNNKLDTVEKLKQETRFFQQIMILAAIDYHSSKRMFVGFNGYIAKDTRFRYGDTPFFINDPSLFNVNRYISDGSAGRLTRDMKGVLQDDSRLEKILNDILGN